MGGRGPRDLGMMPVSSMMRRLKRTPTMPAEWWWDKICVRWLGGVACCKLGRLLQKAKRCELVHGLVAQQIQLLHVSISLRG
jgi:hypothetical protein